MDYDYIVVCGATACGKTNYAHKLAKEINGEIVNADSMQLYDEIKIINASPSDKLKQELSYHAYNFLPITEKYSVIKYVNHVSGIVRDVIACNKIPIIVGGSGMYINSLIYGYNNIPDIDESSIKYVQDLYDSLGKEEFYNKLCKNDPNSRKLDCNNTQRIIRAYNVFHSTGKSIFDFHSEKKILPLEGLKCKIILLWPDRDFLYEMCNKRVISMIDSGAIEEVQYLIDKYALEIKYFENEYFKQNNSDIVPYSNDLYINLNKIIGIKEISNYLYGVNDINCAIDLISARTRQYAKRQITWFSRQIKPDEIEKPST